MAVPRGCSFCHVFPKEGSSHKVADLSEFWRGQKNITLCDPNILACRESKELLQQLADSKAYIDFNQGLDIRLLTPDKLEILKNIKYKYLHMAWDRWEDGERIKPQLKQFAEWKKTSLRHISVYVLCNYDTTIEQDIERIIYIRSLGMSPYVMLYNKESIPRGDIYHKLARWVNNRWVFWKVDNFEEYLRR